jgi:4-hydroxy-4-methyl-2-oxoglutarate aldolase
VIRDLGAISAMVSPVVAQSVFPVPGRKQQYCELDVPITCGGEIIVADIEATAVIPKSQALTVNILGSERKNGNIK